MPRERLAVAVTLALAVGAPWAAARYLRHQIDDRLTPAIAAATGQPVTVGGFEASLTGTIRLRELRVGALLSAEALEASIALDSLLAGQLGADELRVVEPRLRAAIDARGHSEWHDVLARLAARRDRGGGAHAGGGHHLRRIVVSGGDLVLEVGGVEIRARDVELHPQTGGVRLVTGAVTAHGARGAYRGTAELTRLGADVALPALAVERVIATGGRAQIMTGATTFELAGLELVRDRVDAPWRARAEVDDRGAPRRIAAALVSTGGERALGLELDRVPLAVLGPLAPPMIDLALARASGRVTVATGGTGDDRASDDTAGLAVTGRLTLDGARVRHRALADEPVALDGTLDLEARLAGDRLELVNLGLTRGAAALTVAGVAHWQGGRVDVLDATATLAPVECRALVDALPGPLRGPLDQLAMTGAMSAAAHVAFDLGAPVADGDDGVVFDIDLDRHACLVTADPPVIDPRRLATASLQTFPDGHEAMVGPGVGDWVDPARLPGHVGGAFVAAEDARFWDHRGFDAVQIARSLEIDLREGRMARGGSTITQQLIKNSFLHQRRTLARKLQEAVLTWRTEAVLDKRTILARYLNIVELGPGVYGVAAAAQHWFGKPAAHLTVREAAFLAALAPAPGTMTRRIVAAHGLDPATAERVEVTLRAMRRAGVIAAVPMKTALPFRPAAVGR